MSMVTLLTAIQDAITIVNPQDLLPSPTYQGLPPDVLCLPLPEPLVSQLTGIGLPHSLAERISEAYMRKAEELKRTTEDIVGPAYAKLTSLPRSIDSMPLETLQRRFLDLHLQTYRKTLADWANETHNLARSHLREFSIASGFSTMNSSTRQQNKRKFKSEYLPLFEFAFEKDRFPNREDKKHLARISGMSYRQVCVWFQNRRCRHASRVKAHNLTPSPQTFQEMKERLSASARDALSKSPLAAKVGQRADTHHMPAAAMPLVQNATLSPIWSEKEEDVATSQSSHRATSMGVSEISEDCIDFEDCDELEDVGLDDMDDAVQLKPMTSPLTLKSAQRSTNPLNSLKTSKVTAFPAVYKPSKPTWDPFVVEHTPWLRSVRGARTRELIESTPEELEHMMQGFDSMEVDVPVFDCDDSTTSTPNELTRRPSPRRPTSTGLKSSPLSQRTYSSSSSDSWSSGASAPLSRASSYSTAPSSVISSPYHSEVPLPTPEECAVESPSEYVSSSPTALSPSVGEEFVCDTPVDDEVTRAGPFDVPSTKPVSNAHVDAWMSKVSTQDDGAAASKWEQLLAAAVEAAPQPCA